jgi:hypothetical protein
MALIAFDVDGCLIDEYDRPRYDVIAILRELQKYNDIVVWSGGGKDYAANWARKLGLFNENVPGLSVLVMSKYDSKLLDVDIAFDDEDASGLARVWVPVK